MKKIIGFMIALMGTYQALAQTNPFNARDSVQISGKIIGYDPKQAEHFITFSTHDIFGGSFNQAIQIEDNGSFWIKLYQSFEGNIQLNYKDAYINIYTQPKRNISIDIDDKKVNRETENEGAFIAKGELADINNLIFKFSTAFSQHAFVFQTDMGNKKQTDSAFAASVMVKLGEQLRFLNTFIKNNHITDQKFISWQRNQLQYELGIEILFFPFASKLNKDITLAQLLQLIKSIPINNGSAFNNAAYYGFLNLLAGDQQIIINLNPMYNLIKAQNGKNTIGIYLDQIDKFTTGLTKELLYFAAFNNKAGPVSDPTPYLGRFNTIITNPFLKDQLFNGNTFQNTTFKKFDVIERLKTLKVNNALKQRLITLFTTYKGTSLYIDFWGDWCGPCMSELPNYPKLITTLDRKPIKFLFLSTFTSEESMLAIKEKFKINGDFVNLNKDEVSIMNNVFKFHSYPSHFMVNDKGEVLNKAGTMSSSNIQQKAKEIEQFLEKQ